MNPASFLQPQQFFDDAVAHAHRAHQNQQVKNEFRHIAPHGGDRRHAGVDSGRGRRHDGENDAGQGDDDPLQAYPGIGAQEVLSHMAGGFPCETGKRDRRDSGVHIEAEHPGIDGQDHHERQHGDEQASDQGHRP